ncbi:MAG TPA: ChbG/HpnK family deacetylase [Candidatus Methylomirabilis sp.]|nr:ChbG/HpnK family deacetylase [Candidatus Methylomirabilis sp.]
MERFLIINADDFGASTGVNRGILECHTHGVVTSASLMVTGRAVREAVSMSRYHPALSIGLHWDVWGEDEREFDIDNVRAVREEFHRQIDQFHGLLGRMPTHIDSHRHAHREKHLLPVFRELVEPLSIPLRDDGRVRFVGGFYAQWEWMVTNLEYVSVAFLQQMLHQEVLEGWTEFSCHPGYVSEDYTAVYLKEREEEVLTLTDSRILDTIEELGIRLVSYDDYLAAVRA